MDNTIHGNPTAMDITIHASFLPHNDPEASLAFWRDALGFGVRSDVGYGGLRWITVGPPDQPGTSVVLQPPAPPGCGLTEEERRTIVEMMAKGSYAGILLATADVDCVFRDPAGNLVRILELRSQLDRTKPTRRRKPMPKR